MGSRIEIPRKCVRLVIDNLVPESIRQRIVMGPDVKSLKFNILMKSFLMVLHSFVLRTLQSPERKHVHSYFSDRVGSVAVIREFAQGRTWRAGWFPYALRNFSIAGRETDKIKLLIMQKCRNLDMILYLLIEAVSV